MRIWRKGSYRHGAQVSFLLDGNAASIARLSSITRLARGPPAATQRNE